MERSKFQTVTPQGVHRFANHVSGRAREPVGKRIDSLFNRRLAPAEATFSPSGRSRCWPGLPEPDELHHIDFGHDPTGKASLHTGSPSAGSATCRFEVGQDGVEERSIVTWGGIHFAGEAVNALPLVVESRWGRTPLRYICSCRIDVRMLRASWR